MTHVNLGTENVRYAVAYNNNTYPSRQALFYSSLLIEQYFFFRIYSFDALLTNEMNYKNLFT